MIYTVVFFTRTDTSRRVAEKIAGKLTCHVVQITDNHNWSGLFGYIKAGFYSTVDKHVDVELIGDLNDPDEYIVVVPLWAGGIAPAAKTFLKTVPRGKVHLVITSLGSHTKDREGFLSITDITDQSHNEDMAIAELVKKLP